MKNPPRTQDLKGQPTNVPAVGMVDHSPPEQLAIHSLRGFNYRSDRGVLRMSIKSAELVNGRWQLRAA